MSIRFDIIRSLLMALIAISVSLNASAIAQTPEKTTSQAHPFAQLLKGQYHWYLDSARKGDVQATLALIIAEYSKRPI
jgi:hypothetical protein